MSQETPEDTSISDGRRERSVRTRQEFIDASLELIEEGNLVPSAQQIADRAGKTIRSFFRHFDDMSSLFATVEEYTRESVEASFVGGNREGTQQERLLHAVERRADGYEKRKNMVLSTAAQSWRWGILRNNYARYQRGLRKDLDDWLPELKQLDRSEREAVDALASFEMWHRLREHQGLGKKQAINIVFDMINNTLSVSGLDNE